MEELAERAEVVATAAMAVGASVGVKGAVGTDVNVGVKEDSDGDAEGVRGVSVGVGGWVVVRL